MEDKKVSVLETRLNTEQSKKELIEVTKLITDLKKEKKELEKINPAPDSAAAVRLRELDKELKQAAKDKKILNDSFKENLTVIINGDVAGKSLNSLRSAIRLAKSDFNKMIDPADMARQAASIGKIQAQIDKLEAPIQKSKGAFSGIINEMKRMAAIAASAFGFSYVIHIFQNLVTSSSKLSNELSDLRRIGGLTEEEVNKLNTSLRKLDTPTTMSGLRNLAKEAARAGVEGVDNITKYTKALDMLVVVLEDELGDAGTISSNLGKILNVFNGKITDEALTNLGNAIVSLANAGVASGAFITDFTQRVLASAKAANFTLGATVGLAAGFEELGLKAESSGTAFQTLISTIGDDIPKAAKIANKPLKEFQELFAKSPQEALIQYAEGLVKNKGAFSDVTAAFKNAGEEGVRVRQTLFTIGQSGEFLRDKITLGNKAMQETSAITEGFALKNENFAAVVSKIGKVFNQLWVNGPLTDGLKSLAVSFYNLIKPTQNLTEESKKLIEANRLQIGSSQKLLSEYESLTKDGVIPTAKEKERLKIITIQLKDILGESVIKIDKETGALRLNVDAVKELIKQKLLLNNNEAASLALRAENSAKEKSDLIAIGKAQVDELHIRQAMLTNLGLTEDKAASLYNIILGGSAKYQAAIQSEGKERVEAVSSYFRSLQLLSETNDKIAKKDRERLEIIKELQKLGFDSKDVSNLFHPKEPNKVNPAEPNFDGANSVSNDTYKVERKALDDYLKDRLTTITTFSVAERNLQRNLKIQYADKEQKAYGRLLQIQADAAKQKLDIAANGSVEEQAAKEEYRLALNKIDLYWNGLEIDAEKGKLKELDLITKDKKREHELNARITQAQIDLDLTLKNSEKELEAKKKLIKAKFDLATAGWNKESTAYIKAEQELHAILNAMDDEFYSKKAEKVLKYIDVAKNLWTSYSQWLDQADNNRLAKDRRTHDKLVKQYQKALDEKRISNDEFNAKVASADEAYNKKAWEVGKKQFERNKAASIIQITIDTVRATMEASHATGNYYVDAALAVATAAAGALQLGKVLSSEYPEYEKGGWVKGQRHAQGGVVIEAEDGEFIGSRIVSERNPSLAQAIVDAGARGDGIVRIPTLNTNIPIFNSRVASSNVEAQKSFSQNILSSNNSITNNSPKATVDSNSNIDIAALLTEYNNYMKELRDLITAETKKPIVFEFKSYREAQKRLEYTEKLTRV